MRIIRAVNKRSGERNAHGNGRQLEPENQNLDVESNDTYSTSAVSEEGGCRVRPS